MGLPQQHLEQLDKNIGRAPPVGVGQRRALRRLDAWMIKPVRVALERRLDLTQAARARQLRVNERHELALRRQRAHVLVSLVPVHQTRERVPRHRLQQLVNQAIMVPHGIGSSVSSSPASFSNHS